LTTLPKYTGGGGCMSIGEGFSISLTNPNKKKKSQHQKDETRKDAKKAGLKAVEGGKK